MSDQELWFNRPLGYFVRDIGDGGTPSRADEKNFGGPIPWVVITDIQRKIHHTKENLSKKGLASCTSKLWPKNSIILSTGATIGKVGIAKVPLATKQGITGIVAIDYVIPEYLYYELLYKKNNIVAWAQGSTFAEIRVPILTKVPLKVPKNRKIQKKIVIILETIDQSIEKTEALIHKYQQIKAGLMHDLFTRGVTADGKLRPPREQAPELYKETPIGWIPKEWRHLTLGAVTPINYPICYGLVQPGSNDWNGVPIVAINNLNRSFDDTHRSSKEIESSYTRSRIKEGDILLSIKGTIGRVDIVPTGFMGNISRDVARIRPVEKLNRVFLKYLLESGSLQREFMKIVVGTTRMELSINRLKKIPLFIPLIEEQNRIANKLREINCYIFGELMALEKQKKQKSGLMHDLLTGKVQVKVDKEETTHV